MRNYLSTFLNSRVVGWRATVTAGIRIFVGLAFIFFGTVKFVITEFEVAEFVKFGFPDSAVFVYLVGMVEAGAGLMLLIGLGTRLAAAVLAIVMAGAILTAGLQVGGAFHLGVAPTLLAANLYLLWTGSGSRAIDPWLAGRPRTRQHPRPASEIRSGGGRRWPS